MSEQPYTPTTDEVAEVWAMSEPNPDGYTSMGLPVPDETEQRAEFDRFIAKVKADAWDEGHDAATDAAPDGVWPDAWIDTRNPYRQEADQ